MATLSPELKQRLAYLPCDRIILIEADWDGSKCDSAKLVLGVNRDFAGQQGKVKAQLTLDGRSQCDLEVAQSICVGEYGTFKLSLPKGVQGVCLTAWIEKKPIGDWGAKCDSQPSESTEERAPRICKLRGVFARQICQAPFNPWPIDCSNDSLLVCNSDCKLERRRLASIDKNKTINCEDDRLLVQVTKQTPYGTACFLEQRRLGIKVGEPVNCRRDRLLVCELDNRTGKTELVSKLLDIRGTATPIACDEDRILVCDQEGNLIAKPLDLDMSAADLECSDKFVICDAQGQLSTRVIAASSSTIDCDSAQFVVCESGRLVQKSLPQASEAFQCQGNTRSSDQFLTCDSDGQLQQRWIDITSAQFRVGDIVTCGEDGMLIQPLDLSSVEFRCPPRDATPLQCDDGFLVCDNAGDIFNRAIPDLPEPIGCSAAFLVCEGGSVAQKRVPSTPTLSCQAEFLYCDTQGDLVRASITEAPRVPCEAEIVFCDDSGALARSAIAQLDTALSCTDAFLVCEGSSFVQKRVGTSGDLPCDAEVLYCNSAGDLVRGAIPQLDTPIDCSNRFLVCDGDQLSQRRIETGDNLDCTDRFLVCDASGSGLKSAPIQAASAVDCSNELLFCDGSSIRRGPIKTELRFLIQPTDASAATSDIWETISFLTVPPTFEVSGAGAIMDPTPGGNGYLCFPDQGGVGDTLLTSVLLDLSTSRFVTLVIAGGPPPVGFFKDALNNPLGPSVMFDENAGTWFTSVVEIPVEARQNNVRFDLSVGGDIGMVGFGLTQVIFSSCPPALTPPSQSNEENFLICDASGHIAAKPISVPQCLYYDSDCYTENASWRIFQSQLAGFLVPERVVGYNDFVVTQQNECVEIRGSCGLRLGVTGNETFIPFPALCRVDIPLPTGLPLPFEFPKPLSVVFRAYGNGSVRGNIAEGLSQNVVPAILTYFDSFGSGPSIRADFPAPFVEIANQPLELVIAFHFTYVTDPPPPCPN